MLPTDEELKRMAALCELRKNKVLNLKNLLIIFFLLIFFWFIGIRFTSPRLNYLAFGAILLIPIICFISTRLNRNEKNKIVRIVAALSILTIPSFLIWLFLVSIWVPDIMWRDIDYSFELIRTEKVGANYIRVYRTNGGATTDFGVVVRKETKLLPGLYFIKPIGSKYHAGNADIINENGVIRIQYDR